MHWNSDFRAEYVSEVRGRYAEGRGNVVEAMSGSGRAGQHHFRGLDEIAMPAHSRSVRRLGRDGRAAEQRDRFFLYREGRVFAQRLWTKQHFPQAMVAEQNVCADQMALCDGRPAVIRQRRARKREHGVRVRRGRLVSQAVLRTRLEKHGLHGIRDHVGLASVGAMRERRAETCEDQLMATAAHGQVAHGFMRAARDIGDLHERAPKEQAPVIRRTGRCRAGSRGERHTSDSSARGEGSACIQPELYV